MYGWAPLAIMGEEINKLENPANGQASSLIDRDNSFELTRRSPTRGEEETILPTAGIYLGIWNIYATIPQFLATFIAMIVFSILEPGKSPELTKGDGEKLGDASRSPVLGLSGTAVCLTIGAVCSFVAGIRTFRLRRT